VVPAVALVAALGLVYRRGSLRPGACRPGCCPGCASRARWDRRQAVFAIALFGWALPRHNPQISATEKPMEFAFLNSILRDPALPPADPWLAGYDISYYYFGYVLMAMLVI
jgi:hypothetical protein